MAWFRVIVLENLIFSQVQWCCVICVADLTQCDKVFVVVLCFAMFSGLAVWSLKDVWKISLDST